DTGVGIDASLLPKLFTAFEQGGPEITRRYGGLGLGLAISRTLAAAHEGTLMAESDGIDKGATFTVELPVISPVAHPSSGESDNGDGAAQMFRILLVEDHCATLMMLAKLLASAGHEVTTA